MTKRSNERLAGLPAAACALLLSFAAGADVKLPADLSELLAQDVVDAEALMEQERERNRALGEALRAENATGIRRQYRNRELVELTPQSAALMALERNLAIQRGELGVRTAKAALVEAEAIFDPTLTVSATYAENQNEDREENVQDADKLGTVAIDDPLNPGNPINVIRQPPGGVIDFLIFNNPRQAGLFPSSETASESDLPGPDTDYTYDLTVSQNLPWGADFAITLELVDKERFFINNEGARSAGLATTGSFGRPWTAEITGTYSTPIPFTENYGEYSNNNTQVLVSRIGRDQSLDVARKAINDTLLAVDLAYYDLTFAVLDLEISIANQRQVEALLEGTNRLFEQRLITTHSKAQVEAELERVKGVVEGAWNAFIATSNTLNELLDADETQMFLPLGYANMFRSGIEIRTESDYQAQNNPDYAIEEKNVAIADVREKNAVVGAKPDLDLRLSMTSAQGGRGATFGHDFSNAMINIIEPDRVTFNASLNLRRPWGNRAAEANETGFALGHDISQLALQSTLNDVNQRLDDALIDYHSAKARVAITERTAELARTRYEKSVDQQRRRAVTEFEIIEQSGELLDAERDWLLALRAWKQAESSVLAAAGLLAGSYGERTALNDLERHRIHLLASQHEFQFFGDAND